MTKRAELFDKYLTTAFCDLNPRGPRQWHLGSYDRIYGHILPDNKNIKILDIGCGMGHFLWYLKKKGYTNLLGVDISKEAIAFCKRNVIANVLLINNLSQFLKKHQNSFDLIVMNDVLEHIIKKNIIRTLREIGHSLKNAGTLLVKVPNATQLLAGYSRYLDFTHETVFTEKSLLQVLKIAGYTRVKIIGERDVRVDTPRAALVNITRALWRLNLKLIYKIERGRTANPKIFSVALIAIARK